MRKTKTNSKELAPTHLRTWIEVDRRAIASNYRLFRSLIGSSVKLMAVVKSNAYGHSLLDFAKEVESLGADWVGVDSIVEGLALREVGITLPLLVLGYTLPERLKEAASSNISVTVSSLDHLRLLAVIEFPVPLRLHLKVDTGMHRQGFLLSDLPAVLAFLKRKKQNRTFLVEGLYTHFASAKNPAFPSYTHEQIREFEEWRKALAKTGGRFIAHTASTAGTMLFPESHYHMVRIGIGLYGIWPSPETESFFKERCTLEPALSWKTIISEVKTLPKGSKIGYDSTETLEEESKVAICPVGYWHGYSRRLSSIAHVALKGKLCRVLGRVSMDMIVIDISDVNNVGIGDTVTLIGSDGKASVSAADLASLDETSLYETITRINPLIKRIYH